MPDSDVCPGMLGMARNAMFGKMVVERILGLCKIGTVHYLFLLRNDKIFGMLVALQT